MDESILASVKDFYGKELKGTGDLKVADYATLTGLARTKMVRDAISDVHEEVKNRYYGCGMAIPQKLEGMKILDLGCGSGHDCFALSKLVGPEGHVTGLDMTEEQLEVANKYIPYHTEKFGYSKPNINFVKGFIEKLTEAGIPENSVDIIISNCTVNLSPDKAAVFSEAYKVLKVGGEMYFSDMYTDTDLPESVRKHEVLWGEGLSGALYWKDLYLLASSVGLSAPRLVTASPIPVENEEYKKVIGDARYASVTYRMFKVPADRQAARQVIYSGEITGWEKDLEFDHQTSFKTDEVASVGSELAAIFLSSRFKDEFKFQSVIKISCCQTQEVDPFEYLERKAKAGCKVQAPLCGGY